MALLFALGQHYPLIPWVLVGAILFGALAVFIVARSIRGTARSRPWFSTESGDQAFGRRPGLGNLLILILIGPAPFLLSAALQDWLPTLGLQIGWVLSLTAVTLFVFIFGGYCLIDALLNRRVVRASLAAS